MTSEGFDYATDNDPTLEYKRKLGSGGFGTVHEIYDITDQKSFARKLLHLPSIDERLIRKEVDAIKKLCGLDTHPNIIQVLNHGSLTNPIFYFIDMELCELNLYDYIHGRNPPNPLEPLPPFDRGDGAKASLQIWTVMSQIAGGVEFIHRQNQVHRDVKPANVLYSSKSSVWKLTDFGLSCEGSSKTNRPTQYGRGTPGYRAPELIESDREPSFNNKVDIWAMGCILYEFATGIRLFKSDWEVFKYSSSGKDMEIVLDDTFDAFSKEDITEHIIEMLRIAPSERPSATNLSHDFTNSVRQCQVTKVNHHDRDKVSGKSALSIVNEEISGNSPPPAKRQRTRDGNDIPQNVSTPLRSIKILPPFLETIPLFSTGEEIQKKSPEFVQNTPEFRNPRYLIEALLLASKFGNTTEVRSLLGKGVDVNAVGEDKGNALTFALNAGHEDMALLLLEMGADMNSQYRGKHPLHKASMFGLEAVVRLLLKKGAEVDIRSDKYETPLHIAANYGHGAILRILLENGADINAKGQFETTALRIAVNNMDESVVRLLLENGAYVNADGFRGTPLQITMRGDEWMVQFLLKNGAIYMPSE